MAVDDHGEVTDLDVLRLAMDDVQRLQDLATKYGISDIFQDNGGKVLQTLIILGLRSLRGREGNDAVDSEGNEYELKSVNVSLGVSRGITTHHHLNLGILQKYREVKAWYISLYEHIRLIEIYRLTPAELEPVFSKWEARLLETNDAPINNPKIPIRFVKECGTRVWPIETPSQQNLLPTSSPLNPDDESLP
jgi:hypothetical protein